MFLCPLSFHKVFIIIFSVVYFLSETRNIRLLLKVLVQISLNDLVDELIEPSLAGDVKRLSLEQDTLPQVIELACVILYGG
jgi:hypothetical protein